MGKRRLLACSPQMFTTPYKKINTRIKWNVEKCADKDVSSKTCFQQGMEVSDRENTDGEAQNNKPTFDQSSSIATSSKSFTFPATYSTRVMGGKLTVKIQRNCSVEETSPYSLYPSRSSMEQLSDHQNVESTPVAKFTESKRCEKATKEKVICRRSYTPTKFKSIAKRKIVKIKPLVSVQNSATKSLLLTLIDKTMKEINNLHERQKTLRGMQLSPNAVGQGKQLYTSYWSENKVSLGSTGVSLTEE